MASTPSVRVVKSFTYKAQTVHFSNRYHFNGGTPPDATHWHTLTDNITTAEKAIFAPEVTIVEAICYAAGSDVPVASKTYSLAGTWSAGGSDHPVPGDCAGLIRYSTTARTSKNHPVYLFNYYHHVYANPSVDWDKLPSTMRTAMGTYASSWISGFSDGGSVTAVRAGPNGATATGSLVEEFITHRDFPSNTSV